MLNDVTIRSTTKINILGVIFDQKLQWSDHISYCISKSNKALVAIRLIKRYFNSKELLQLVTSNFYSILYYNSEIWHLDSLNSNLKQKLLSSSAKAIKTCAKCNTQDISFLRLHEMFNRATPENYLKYRHALTLHKTLWRDTKSLEFAALNINIILTSRQSHFASIKSNRLKVGLNAIANRFYILNKRIPLCELNKSLESFKIYCKKEFLQHV